MFGIPKKYKGIEKTMFELCVQKAYEIKELKSFLETVKSINAKDIDNWSMVEYVVAAQMTINILKMEIDYLKNASETDLSFYHDSQINSLKAYISSFSTKVQEMAGKSKSRSNIDKMAQIHHKSRIEDSGFMKLVIELNND